MSQEDCNIEIDKTKKVQICTSCHLEKELKDFSFEYGRYRRQCRKCKTNKIKIPPAIFKINDILSRNCNKCNQIKPLTEFHKKSNRKIPAHCKQCCSFKRKEYYKNNKEKEDKRNKRYWYTHREEARIRKREYERNRKHTDIKYRIKSVLTSGINYSIKNHSKSDRTLSLLGCSLEFFFKHIEAQFTEGMTWDNHGHGENKWNLDHIIPREVFNLLEPKHQQICFNYKNIQPLWYTDNVIKSDFLSDKRRARDLTPEQKLDYLKSLGYDV